MRASADRSPAHGRLPVIDSLRGLALFGVFGANLLIFSGFEYMTEQQSASLTTTGFDRIARLAERLIIENKFMGLFSFLFGISFWLFLDRVSARGRPATQLFYRRIGWLFLIGALHGEGDEASEVPIPRDQMVSSRSAISRSARARSTSPRPADSIWWLRCPGRRGCDSSPIAGA